MRPLTLIAHTSLDGFVAGPTGELDGFEPGEENLQFVCKLTEDADAALFGRISYQLLDGHWPGAGDRPNASKGEIAYSNWYNAARKIVISRTLAAATDTNTTILRDNVPEEISKIKQQEGKRILIFGSPAISQWLMRLGLIDSYWIFINPVIFGEGIPLFAPLTNRIGLKLGPVQRFANGEMAVNYLVER